MSDPGTRAERALDVLTTLTGSGQVARAMSQNIGSRGALGDLGHHNGFGEIWGRTELSRRDRSLAVIAFQAAYGRQTELRFHILGGLNHGLRIEEIDETILQVSTYAGASLGISAAAVMDEVVAQREGTEKRRTPPARLELKDPAKRRADGLDVLETLLAHLRLDPKEIEARILATQGFMGELVLDWAFGDVWSRPQLSRRDRSFVVISALAALNLEHELETHLQGALNHGVMRAEIEEVMITLILYGGFSRAIEGLTLARKVFARADARVDRDVRQDVSDVLVRYATGIDRRDWALFRSCFTESCQADYGDIGVWYGADAITGWMEQAHARCGHTLHRITNQAIVASGDGVASRSYVDALVMASDNQKGTRAVGYYDDELVRTDAGWKVARRRFTMVLLQSVIHRGAADR